MTEAKLAILRPAKDEGVEYSCEAVAAILRRTKGYPYFLQEWGKHGWNRASPSPFPFEDVEAASTTAIAALDESFPRVRFDRLTPTERT